ncbi:aminopeptidase P N-terminal domain-containing protein [Prochlorococcus sp. MIT 1307]|uniref:aminopeptidase P N-terminal domain-containing protein n=1 Tax=Prochlorococcus sp. MIT 1307 TaxID=3096219 RepID=UPI002A75BE28|nr:aminopeptidase P N-terminal domain-containing protein [Prochlorococcus sp. MIT 1307]
MPSVIDQHGLVKRRDRFLRQLGGYAAIIPAAPMVVHHADCEYPFRQNSDFWYLTGFDEPDAVALFLPHRALGERFVLFVLPRDPALEAWTGSRSGTQGVVDHFGAEVAHPLEELPLRLKDYLKGAEGIAFRVGKHPKIEPIVLKCLTEQLDSVQRCGSLPFSLIAPCPILHQLRLYKESWELELMREAARISAKAHELARNFARPGMNERQVQALIEKCFLEHGARGPAYGSIVAGGDNACILHYTSNNAPLRDGELLLIDAGCSLFDYYNGDITRTFPINGRFSGEQKDLYQVVLAAQQAALECVVPGQNAEAVHAIAVRVIVEGLLDLGILKGSIDSLIEQDAYRHIYMHRTGHWLGLDVHDVGAYRLGDYPVELEPGMTLTVEPGIYVSDRFPVPEGQPEIDNHWKGIGIRIEDDVLVTDKRPEVLSEDALKSLEDMQK